MPADVPKRSVLKLLIFVVCGAALMWAVITYTYVDYLAGYDPEASLRIRTNAEAQLNLAEQRLEALHAADGEASARGARALAPSAQPGGDDEAVRIRALSELAARGILRPDLTSPETGISQRSPEKEALYQMVRDALRRDPLNSRGLRLLAQLTEGHAPEEEVAKLMRMAASRNVHESAAVFWLMNHALKNRNFADVVKYADVVLRTQSRLLLHAINALARACDDPQGLEEVSKIVKGNPPWRRQFFGIFPKYVSDARIPLHILIAVKETRTPPLPEDLASYANVLIDNRFYDLAYYTWLQLLPPEHLAKVTAPYNNEFELQPSGVPFDWIIPKSSNVNAGIVPKQNASSGKVLSIEFGLGRIEFAGVQQLVLLPPGAYRFSANFRAQVNGRRGLVWAVTCASGKELGRSQMMQGTVQAWTPIGFDFRVPDSECPAQQLRLFHDARSASEQLVTGWSHHEHPRITRLDEAQ